MALEFRFSGGQNNTAANGSIGGQRSDTAITTDVLENLFDNISRNEALLGRTEFRCIYIYNTGGGHVSGTVIEITTNPAVTQLSVGLDSIGKGDGRNDGIAASIVTEDTSPAGVGFFSESNSDDGNFDTVILPIGLLKSGEGLPIWLKRKTEQAVAQTISLTMVITHGAESLPGEDIDDGGGIGELLRIDKVASGAYVIGTAKVEFSDLG